MQLKYIIQITILFICLCLNWINAGGNAFPNLKAIHCVGNYPTQNDLHSLLHSLGKIINFSFAHCKQLGMDLLFGLFFVDANLRFTNHDSMPASYQIHLKSLLNTNHKTVACVFANRVDTGQKIVTLFKSARMWYTRQKSFKLKKNVQEKIPIDTELKGYPDWDTYHRIVLDWDSLTPSPALSDKCLMKLADNEESSSADRSGCRIPQDCHDMLIDGSNHGYALTHRLLLLIAAHFGRGCTIFSDQQDKAMRDKFCEMIYVEAHYIADNGFHLVDLLLEQIALCSLDGHSEFISRHWMNSIQQFQTKHGCFKEPLAPPRFFIPASDFSSKFSKGDSPNGRFKMNQKPFRVNNIMNGTCSTHVTAVAAAAISSVIRFILENDDILFVRCRT